MDEQKIMTLLKSQDEEAISLLYDKYSAILYGMVLRIVGSHEIAEDILQQIFFKAWKDAYKYDKTKENLLAWLLRIAKDTTVTLKQSSQTKLDEKPLLVAAISYPENNVAPLNLNKVKESLDKIEPKYRKLIDLIYFQGFTYQEVEKKLNIPYETIKTQLYEACEQLKIVFGKLPITFDSITII